MIADPRIPHHADARKDLNKHCYLTLGETETQRKGTDLFPSFKRGPGAKGDRKPYLEPRKIPIQGSDSYQQRFGVLITRIFP